MAIDSAMPFEQASIIGCAVPIGADAVFNAAKVTPGQMVAVFGCGGVGFNAIQAAAPAGASRIVGVDIQSDSTLLSKRQGVRGTWLGSSNGQRVHSD